MLSNNLSKKYIYSWPIILDHNFEQGFLYTTLISAQT